MRKSAWIAVRRRPALQMARLAGVRASRISFVFSRFCSICRRRWSSIFKPDILNILGLGLVAGRVLLGPRHDAAHAPCFLLVIPAAIVVLIAPWSRRLVVAGAAPSETRGVHPSGRQLRRLHTFSLDCIRLRRRVRRARCMARDRRPRRRSRAFHLTTRRSPASRLPGRIGRAFLPAPFAPSEFWTTSLSFFLIRLGVMTSPSPLPGCGCSVRRATAGVRWWSSVERRCSSTGSTSRWRTAPSARRSIAHCRFRWSLVAFGVLTVLMLGLAVLWQEEDLGFRFDKNRKTKPEVVLPYPITRFPNPPSPGRSTCLDGLTVPDSLRKDAAEADRQILAAVAGGSADALERLYDRYAATAYGLARRILAQPDLAEEVVQDVFSQVWREATPLRRRARERGGVDRAPDAHARDRSAACPTRASRLRIAASNRPPVAAAHDARPESGAGRHLVRGRAARARRARRIPDEQRALVDLAYYEGLTHSEIAARTGVPLGTVKTRLRSAMMTLEGLTLRKAKGTRQRRSALCLLT